MLEKNKKTAAPVKAKKSATSGTRSSAVKRKSASDSVERPASKSRKPSAGPAASEVKTVKSRTKKTANPAEVTPAKTKSIRKKTETAAAPSVSSDKTEQLHQVIIDAIQDKKGHEIISLDLRNIKDAVADYFIVVHGDSKPQVKAIRDSVVEKAREAGFKPYHTEGEKQGDWIIVDFADIVVHVFEREKRFYYQLEEIWHDARTTNYR